MDAKSKAIQFLRSNPGTYRTNQLAGLLRLAPGPVYAALRQLRERHPTQVTVRKEDRRVYWTVDLE